jgi:2-polyprenyl-3-methyl-5-hydroxy-6-metoxy-1,4-benzoquinol methylase
MILDKSAFDAACQPGIRAALAASNLALRHAEQESFNLALDEKGDFLPGVSERRDCPLCAAPHESGAPVLRAHGMQLLRCSACRLVYSREVIRQAQDHQRYRADAPATAAFVALKENPVYRKLETTKAGYVIGQLSGFSETGKLLDIGASTGVVLEVARNMGWNAHGVEINAEAARQCQSQNLKVVCDAFPCAFPAEWNIEGKSGAEGFQAVVMLDILEHTALPRSFLSAVYRCLKPGGWLAVQVPNFRSLLLTIEGSRNNNICHGHWNYFESATLVDLLGREGFETRFLETYISELDKTLAYPRDCVAAAWEKLLGTPLDNPPPPPPQKLDANRLHREMLGYKLFGIFRKIPI